MTRANDLAKQHLLIQYLDTTLDILKGFLDDELNRLQDEIRIALNHDGERE